VVTVCKAKKKQLGDGNCDEKNNIAACGWDLGDCCSVSCEQNKNKKTTKKCGNKGYDCKDPAFTKQVALQNPGREYC
jgi:hypothetical protein